MQLVCRDILARLLHPLVCGGIDMQGWRWVRQQCDPGRMILSFENDGASFEVSLWLCQEEQRISGVAHTHLFDVSIDSVQGQPPKAVLEILLQIIRRNESKLAAKDVDQLRTPHVQEMPAPSLEGVANPGRILFVAHSVLDCPHSLMVEVEILRTLQQRGCVVDVLLFGHQFTELYPREIFEELVSHVYLQSEVGVIQVDRYVQGISMGYSAELFSLAERGECSWSVLDIHPNRQLEIAQKYNLQDKVFRIFNPFPGFREMVRRTIEHTLGGRGAVVKLSFISFPTPYEELHKRAEVTTGPEILAVGQHMRDYDTFLDAMEGIDTPGRIITFLDKVSITREIPSHVQLQGQGEATLEFIRSIAGARVVVIPLRDSLTITSGLTCLFWAMAFGKPIVAADTATMRPFLPHRELGLLYPPGDIGVLRSAIQFCLDNPTMAGGYGIAAEEFIKNHCQARDMAAILTHIS